MQVTGGAGDDDVDFVVRNYASFDGGEGSNALTAMATELSDDIVVTSNGVFGAGLAMFYKVE